jgi:hypothetical protein
MEELPKFPRFVVCRTRHITIATVYETLCARTSKVKQNRPVFSETIDAFNKYWGINFLFGAACYFNMHLLSMILGPLPLVHEVCRSEESNSTYHSGPRDS